MLVSGVVARAAWSSALLVLAAPGTVILSPLFGLGTFLCFPLLSVYLSICPPVLGVN